VTTSGTVRGLLRSGAGIAVAMAVQNVATYAFTIVAARRLGPAEYSAVASLMGLLLVVVVLSLGLQATGARKIAAEPARRAEIEGALMSATYRSALGLGVLCLVLTPLIAWGLDLDWRPAVMIGLSAIPLTIIGGQSGVLQGEHRWRPLGAMYLALGVGRLAIGGLALLISPTAFAAMIGVAVAAWIPALVGAMALGHVGPRAATRATVERGEQLLREVLGNSHALLAFFALSNADVVIARVVFDEHVAGLYAGGLILTKAVLFLPQFVVVIVFPAMASAAGRREVYLKGLVVVGLIGVLATLGALVFSDLAITFIGGPAYQEIEPLIGWFALLGTLLAMIQLMVYEVVARQQRASVWLLWGGLALVASTATYVVTAGQLLLAVLVVDAVLLIALLAIALVGGVVPAAAGADGHVERDRELGG
jgi:O-antigen/teichoic acid export membrane protein